MYYNIFIHVIVGRLLHINIIDILIGLILGSFSYKFLVYKILPPVTGFIFWL